MRKIRTWRAPMDRPLDRTVYLLPVDHVLDADAMTRDEIRAMQARGEGEWRINLDAPEPRHLNENIFVRVPAAERAN